MDRNERHLAHLQTAVVVEEGFELTGKEDAKAAGEFDFAGGAMGGLVLHFICPIADTGHVALAHVGGMALAAAVGALLLSGVGRR